MTPPPPPHASQFSPCPGGGGGTRDGSRVAAWVIHGGLLGGVGEVGAGIRTQRPGVVVVVALFLPAQEQREIFEEQRRKGVKILRNSVQIAHNAW